MKKRLRRLLFWLTMYIAAAGASTMAASSEDTFCTVTERSGYVAVVRAGQEDTLTGIGACYLPGEDREKLKNGITVASREELLLLLEDLGS